MTVSYVTDSAKACKIIAHHGGGLYTVEIQYDDTPRTDRIATLEAKLIDPKLNDNIGVKYQDYINAKQTWEAWVAEQDAKIVAFAQAQQIGNPILIDQARANLQETTNKALETRNRKIETKLIYTRALATKTAIQAELGRLVRVGNSSLPLIQVWSIDKCDGVDGRYIYPNDSFAPLVCLNYNADGEHYLLPARNTGYTTISPLGVYNVMSKYRDQDKGIFNYWNMALEPGFARWKPILLRGILVAGFDPIPSCISSPERLHNFRVFFPDANSRFGYDLVFGTYDLPFGGSVSGDMFFDGDEVAVLITEITQQRTKQQKFIGMVNNVPYRDLKIIEANGVSGSIIGWIKNPRSGVPVNYTAFTDADDFTVGYGSGSTIAGDGQIFNYKKQESFAVRNYTLWKNDTYYDGITTHNRWRYIYWVSSINSYDNWYIKEYFKIGSIGAGNRPYMVLKNSGNQWNKTTGTLNGTNSISSSGSSGYKNETLLETPKGNVSIKSYSDQSYSSELNLRMPGFIVDGYEQYTSYSYSHHKTEIKKELTHFSYVSDTGINGFRITETRITDIKNEVATPYAGDSVTGDSFTSGNLVNWTRTGGQQIDVYHIDQIGCVTYWQAPSGSWQTTEIMYSSTYTPYADEVAVFNWVSNTNHDKLDTPETVLIWPYNQVIFDGNFLTDISITRPVTWPKYLGLPPGY